MSGPLLKAETLRAEWLWIAATALLWGAYPLVARSAGYEGPRAAWVLMLVGFVPISVMAYLDGGVGWPSAGGWLKLVIAGLMMGGGLLAFITVANGKMEVSVSLPIVDVAMLMVSAVGAIVFFAEPVTAKKLVGIALLLAGIWLLRPT